MNKKLRTVLLATTVVMVQGAAATSLDPWGGQSVIQTGQFGSDRTGESVLLVQMGDAYGVNLIAELSGLGASVTAIAPAELESYNLRPYCLVILEFQNAWDLTAIGAANAGATNVASYVAGGGTLWLSGGGQAFDTPLLLPGGAFAMLTGSSFTGNNPHVDLVHPILAGLADPLVGTYANHETLNGLPGSANVILNNEYGLPAAAEYTYGAGMVLATTAPSGFYYYAGGHDCWDLWVNSAIYSMSICEEGGLVGADEQAADFALANNYPNPFNPSTTISYSLEETGVANLSVFNLAGQLVATLVDGLVERGKHQITFEASQLTSGVYYYTLSSGNQVDTKKMVLVK